LFRTQSSEIFNLFDNLLLLERGGRQTYFGPREDAVEFFEQIEGGEKLLLDGNPAEFLLAVNGAGIDSAAGGGGHDELNGRANWNGNGNGRLPTQSLSKRWKESEQCRKVEEEIDQLVEQSLRRPDKKVSVDASPGVVRQTVELTKRMSRHFWRGKPRTFLGAFSSGAD
jgi:ATP-binding cassette subfamily G (WHITE) protein 2 (SNQ2)